MDIVHYKNLKVCNKYIINGKIGYFMGEQSEYLGFYTENNPVLFWIKKTTIIYEIKHITKTQKILRLLHLIS